MKLILKEYLASLRERGELDSILPDLLRQMGLTVYSSPRRGVKEYGVDIGAVGSINGDEEKVYLLSVKSGNLTRDTWNGSSNQSLRPSLDEIIDSYIPTRIPPEHIEKPIEICLCFGGEIHSGIRQDVTGYTKRNETDSLKFREWNGDVIAEYILAYFFNEDLAPTKHRSLLRKSIAVLEEPDVSIQYYKELVNLLCKQDFHSKQSVICVLRQLHIYTWMLFAWAREVDNLESVYISCEYVLLKAWDISKIFSETKGKNTEVIHDLILELTKLHLNVAESYITKVVVPSSKVYLGLSTIISPSCAVDVNLKLFDVLGRVALFGLWNYQQYTIAIENKSDENTIKLFENKYHEICNEIVQMIDNNEMLLSPYKDDQALDIMLTIFCLSRSEGNLSFVESWLQNLVNLSIISFDRNQTYLSNIQEYEKLIRHPEESTKEYREKVIQGSILLPNLALVAGTCNFKDVYSSIQKFHSEFLTHANMQLYFFDEDSEKYLYNNNEIHGASWSDVDIQQNSDDLLVLISEESKKSNDIWNLSAMKNNLFPIVLMACRHYRMPFPIHFFI